MTPSRPQRAFTLVELLVVVSIIVVLLALLMPAMSKAIYQARLVQCSTNLKAIASGATAYAFDYQKAYPECQFIGSYPYGLAFGAQDDRPRFKGYIELTWLIDPLCEPVDLNGGPEEVIYISYPLFFGFHYDGEVGMDKVGDAWEVRDHRVTGRPRYAFNWMVADLDIIGPPVPHAAASHPDKRGILFPQFAKGGTYEQGENEKAFEAARVTFSFWRNLGTYRRGPVDLNAASSDGSVFRLTDVPINESDRDSDGRTVHIANIGSQSKGGVWMNIAKP